MQKNFCLGFLVLLIAGMYNVASAKTVEVEALEAFTTANPPAAIRVKLLNELELSNNLTIEPGCEISGSLVDVESPKRLKRNAKFSFKPNWYIDENGEKKIIHEDITASYTTTLDTAQLAKKTALSVGNHFVKGLTVGVAAVEGAVENESGNRLKSGAKSVYEATPFSYANKGQDIQINKAQVFYLKFPNVEDNTKKGVI